MDAAFTNTFPNNINSREGACRGGALSAARGPAAFYTALLRDYGRKPTVRKVEISIPMENDNRR
jgi:hypothetical protein